MKIKAKPEALLERGKITEHEYVELKRRSPEARRAYYDGYIVAMRLMQTFLSQLSTDVKMQLDLAESMRENIVANNAEKK